MKNLTYITGNYGKYISVKEKFESADVNIEYYKCDLEEPDINDIEIISKSKAAQAYKILGTPVFAADTGFYIDSYPNNPGYPGAFVKRSGISSDIESLLQTMQNENNRKCCFVDCLTFYDGKDFFSFFGISSGNLSYELRGNPLKKAKSALWQVFIPNNCSKTLAEMTDEERKNRNDGHTSATDLFINWYTTVYLGLQSLSPSEVQKVKRKNETISK